MNAARQRYRDVIIALADKYPTENLLLVSHGEHSRFLLVLGLGLCLLAAPLFLALLRHLWPM